MNEGTGEWKGRVCCITGASSGFGRALARRLAGKGATVVVVARRESRLAELVSELGGAPHSYYVCDVSNLEQVRGLASWLADRAGHLDVLVNNAGRRSAGTFTEATSEEMSAVVGVNLTGQIFCTRELLGLLKAAPGGRFTPVVVNIASIAGRLPIPGSADYTASKFGLVGFTESIWHDLAPLGIRAMMVNPGTAETEGFPMKMLKASPSTAWVVMDAERVAKAIVRGIERGAFEVRVQWWLHALYHLGVLGGPIRRMVTRKLGGVARSEF